MDTKRVRENYTMLCDFYELTMGQGYFQCGKRDTITYFDVFFRDIPDGGGYAVCAGLDQLIDYIEDLAFTEEDIECLRSKQIFSEAFLTYLRTFRLQKASELIAGGCTVTHAAELVGYENASGLYRAMHGSPHGII